MFGTTGNQHPKTKKEQAIMMRLEARSHALECDRLADACRTLGSLQTAEALEKAAKFIRYFAGKEE